jgi:hypothetical protein
MSVLQYQPVQFHELEEALNCIPSHTTGLDKSANLKLWRRWYLEGSLQICRVEATHGDGSRQIQALGVSAWITDSAVTALRKIEEASSARRVYEAASKGLSWLMDKRLIQTAHARNDLNLMVLHFWSSVDVSSPAFQPVFFQAHSGFRDMHQGFGVKLLLQEVPTVESHLVAAAGMRSLHQDSSKAVHPVSLMGISREDASANPGSTFSFLFFSPARRLTLKPAVQRMLVLALRQLTDQDIATTLGCSRDYVRKLWTDAYDAMQETGALLTVDTPQQTTSAPVRGRERRRTALEFVRANPHELRPGLPVG